MLVLIDCLVRRKYDFEIDLLTIKWMLDLWSRVCSFIPLKVSVVGLLPQISLCLYLTNSRCFGWEGRNHNWARIEIWSRMGDNGWEKHVFFYFLSQTFIKPSFSYVNGKHYPAVHKIRLHSFVAPSTITVSFKDKEREFAEQTFDLFKEKSESEAWFRKVFNKKVRLVQKKEGIVSVDKNVSWYYCRHF